LEGLRVVFPERLRIETESFESCGAGEGEALIETEASLISRENDLTALTGDFPKDSARWRYTNYSFVPELMLMISFLTS